MINLARLLPILILQILPPLAAGGCVESFRTNPELFEVCKTRECILFRTEEPFIYLDPRMNSTKDERPFLRDDRKTKWVNLEGPFFEIISEIQALSTAYYVWGGPTCKFDDMVSFVQNTTQMNATGGAGYKFIAGGILFMLKYRMTIDSIPSAPLLEDQLVIVGPRIDDNATWSSAWEAMWRPFTTKAWLMLMMTILFVLFLRVWVSYFFTEKTPKFKWTQFRDNFIGDYDNLKGNLASRKPIRAPKHRNRMEAKRLNTYLSNGVGIFFVITILYYEIAVVDFIFEDRMDSLGRLDPSKFAITANSTMDRVFQQRYADDVRCKAPCWKRVENISEAYSTITQKRSKHTFTLVYELFNRNTFKEDTDLCKKVQLLEYPAINRRFAGVMFYSPNIDVGRRMEIDQNIVLLREQGKLRDIIHRKIGDSLPTKCETTGSISVLLLSLPLFLFPGPIFAVVFFYMAMYTLKRRNERLDMNDSENGVTPDDSVDTYSGDTTTYNTSSMLGSSSANCDCFVSQSSDVKERELRLYTMKR